MKYTHCFLALAASAALVSVTGCSKQESSTKEPQTASAPANTEKPTTIDTAAAVQATKQAVEQSIAQTVTAAQSTITNTQAAVQSTVETQKLALAQAATNQVQALTTSASNQFQGLATAATNRVFTTLGVTNQATATLTNPAQAIASAATNQFQALATAATNRVLATLGVTNQSSAAITNQVEALLEKAKLLSSNQKYQEALGTVTELYKNKLTPEQKLRVDALKTELQTALAQKATEGAGSALGGLLRGKKE